MAYPSLDIPFRGIVEQSLAGIYVIQDEVFQYANATFAGIFGYTPEELIGKRLSELVAPDVRDEQLANYRRRISGEVASIRFFTKGIHKDGSIVHLEVHGSRLLYRRRPVVVGVGIDITERVRQQEELRASRERLRASGQRYARPRSPAFLPARAVRPARPRTRRRSPWGAVPLPRPHKGAFR